MIEKIFPIIYTNELKELSNKASVLCLENFYFNIFKIKLDSCVNNEDRLEKFEDRLEVIFPKYNSENFILNYECIKKNEVSEEHILYIFNYEKFENFFPNKLIDNKIISITPSFLLVREYKKNPNFYNFDISSQNLVISKYKNNKIEDIIIYKNEISPIVDNITEFNSLNFNNTINIHLKNIEHDFDIIFTGDKIAFSNLDFDENKLFYFSIEKFNFLKYPNFLPKNLKNKYWLYYLNLKYLFFISICLILIIFSTVFLYYKISKIEEKLAYLESENSLLEENNQDIRSKIAELEDNFIDLEKERAKLSQTDFKITSFIKELKRVSNSFIKLKTIEYDGERIISIYANCSDFSKINDFLNNIQNSEILSLENYDYIIKKENNFEFKLELSIHK